MSAQAAAPVDLLVVIYKTRGRAPFCAYCDGDDLHIGVYGVTAERALGRLIKTVQMQTGKSMRLHDGNLEYRLVEPTCA